MATLPSRCPAHCCFSTFRAEMTPEKPTCKGRSRQGHVSRFPPFTSGCANGTNHNSEPSTRTTLELYGTYKENVLYKTPNAEVSIFSKNNKRKEKTRDNQQNNGHVLHAHNWSILGCEGPRALTSRNDRLLGHQNLRRYFRHIL